MYQPKTVPDVFIIESLSEQDPHDGKILADMLRLAGKNPIYYRCKDSDSFIAGLKIFAASKYRFLHLSCHGTSDSIKFQSGETLDYMAFSSLFEGLKLNVTRIFFSACELGNPNLSLELFKKNKSLYSFVAPCQPITFGNALAIWCSFYIAMFDISSSSMKETDIINKLDKIIQVFEAKFHVSRHNTQLKEMWHYNLPTSPTPYDKTKL